MHWKCNNRRNERFNHILNTCRIKQELGCEISRWQDSAPEIALSLSNNKRFPFRSLMPEMMLTVSIVKWPQVKENRETRKNMTEPNNTWSSIVMDAPKQHVCFFYTVHMLCPASIYREAIFLIWWCLGWSDNSWIFTVTFLWCLKF